MSKAIQVYDDAKEKVVDVPEDEVENITDMMRVFTGIQEVWYLAYKEKISEPNFISGLLRFAISFVKRGLDPNYIDTEPGSYNKSTISAKAEKIWESVGDKIIDIVEDITNSEDDRAAIAKFKKPYKQLSDAEKETLEEDLDDRYTLDAIAYCLICKALDLWTPKFWRLDAVAAKIAEVEKTEFEKEKAIAEKEKGKAEKRVPVGS